MERPVTDHLGRLALATPCPSCGGTMSFHLRCDLDHGECLKTVACDACSAQYVVRVEGGDVVSAERLDCDEPSRACRLHDAA